MEKYLLSIAKQVLSSQAEGLSKVRFAKTLYFVHKTLVQKNLSNVKDLGFIRMPLGPVPIGFMELADSPEIKTSDIPTPLIYNQLQYSLNDGSSVTHDQRYVEIKKSSID